MTVPIRGITLLHPWAFAIAKLGKDVENRSQHITRKGGHVGMYLAIHGGVPPKQGHNKKWDQFQGDVRDLIGILESNREISERAEAALDVAPTENGAVSVDMHRLIVPGIVAVARVSKCVAGYPSPWTARGQWQYVLEDVLVLHEPVPHVGSQMLWPVEREALAKLIGAWEAAHGGDCPFRPKELC